MPEDSPSGSSRRSLRSAMIGLLATLFIAVLLIGGGMSRLEQITFDQRSKWFSRSTPPPSKHIVHVHIDDNALSTVGRWPWPRENLAGVVDELNLAGAKVVAFDLLFKSPQPKRIELVDTTDPDRPKLRTVQDDRLLAESIARSQRTVLAMDLAAVPMLSEIEQRAIIRLKKDLGLDEQELAEQLNATPTERRAIREIFNELRTLAARQRIDELFAAETPPTLDDACRAMLPGVENPDPGSPAVIIISREFDRVASLFRFLPMMPEANRPDLPIRTDVPILVLANAATSAGVVSYEADNDGVVRSTPLWVTTEGHLFPHFALAAACELLDVPFNTLQVNDDETIIPNAKLPDGETADIRIPMVSARRGDGWSGYPRDRVLITWPTNAKAWPYLYDEQKQQIEQQVPIGTIVELKRARQNVIDAMPHVDNAYWALLNTPAVVGMLGADAHKSYQAIRDRLADPNLSDAEREDLLARRAELRKPILDNARFLQSNFAGVSDAEFKAMLDTIEDADERATVADARQAINSFLPPILRQIENREQVAEMQNVLRRAVEGRICIIGWSATGALADFIPTALYDKTPGPIGHGALVNAILTNHFLKRAPLWLDVLMVLLLGGAVTLIAARFPPISALVISTGFGASYYLFNGLLVFDYGNTVLAVASPCLAGVLAWVGVTVFRLVMEQREKARITRQFKNYVSGDLVDLLVANPAMIKQGRHELTCMFCDIAGFTTVTEALGPEKIIELLNRYLGVMTQRIMEGRGTVNKYMGDCIMAFWGAPIDDDQHAIHTCRSVMDCFAALKELEKDPFFQNVPKLSIRFGVATGPMMVGDCGAPPDRSDYTVIGDVVNLASRLEGANKAFGTKALVNDRTAELVREHMLLRPIGKVRVVGKVEPVTVYNLMNTFEDATDDEKRLAKMTVTMVDAFQAGDFNACLGACDAMVEAFGDAKLTTLYADSCRAYLETAPPESFAGELVLSEK